jgi:hypothetical protein
VYVHVAEETLLTGRGTADVEGVGAIPVAMLRILLGHTRVRLTPGERYRVTPDGTHWIGGDPIPESLWCSDFDPPDTT